MHFLIIFRNNKISLIIQTWENLREGWIVKNQWSEKYPGPDIEPESSPSRAEDRQAGQSELFLIETVRVYCHSLSVYTSRRKT